MFFFFFNDTATTEIYTLSLHDALPIYLQSARSNGTDVHSKFGNPEFTDPEKGNYKVKNTSPALARSEEHTSELQSRLHLVCRLLLEKKKKKNKQKQKDKQTHTNNTQIK